MRRVPGGRPHTAALGAIAAPTLLVWGDQDTFVTRAEQDRLLSRFPGSRLLVYEGTGHAIHWEEPERFAADLMTFIATVSEGLLREDAPVPRAETRSALI